jgi:Family of unknown function (DUF5681)
VNEKSLSDAPSNPGWFRKGRSGNLNGRPRASRVPKNSAFQVLVEKTVTVNDRGGTREITVEEALQQRTFQDALAGKRLAMREVVKWILKREAWLAKHAPKARRPMRPLLTSPDPDNADVALVLLGIATPNPARADWNTGRTQLLLEPWTVQAALRRRRGGQRLTDREHDDIRRCTRDSDSLRWPREIG